jgi:Bacterial Ig-like domain (group 3)
LCTVGISSLVQSALGGMKLRTRSGVLARAVRVRGALLEGLESRTLLSGTPAATAQLQLVSTTGPAGNPTFTYDITVHNTGSTTVGTFWFAWVPGEDFLPSVPLSATSPTGWGNEAGTSSTPAFTGSGNNTDGTAIQWVAQTAGGLIQPGQSLSGFEFTSHDTLAELDGDSPTHAGTPALTSFVYSGIPFSDAGQQFVVSEASTATTASMTSLGTSAAAIVAGTAVTLTATVAPIVAGTPTPTGTVNFVENGTTIGSGTLNSSGIATFADSSLAAGVHTITAAYVGDTTYTASTSSAITETVTPAPVVAPLSAVFTKLTLAPSVIGGQKTSAKATVVITNGSASTFKGRVTIEIAAVADGVSTSIRTLPVSVNIKSHKTMTETVPLLTLPNVATGSYQIVATVTDASQNVSTVTFASPVTIAAPVVLLGATAGAVAPATIVPGKSGSVSVVISNMGNIDSTGLLRVNVALVLNGVSMSVGNLSEKVTVKATKPLSAKLHFKVPKGFAAGDYSLVATVNQGGQTVDATSATTVTVT